MFIYACQIVIAVGVAAEFVILARHWRFEFPSNVPTVDIEELFVDAPESSATMTRSHVARAGRARHGRRRATTRPRIRQAGQRSSAR